MNDVKSEPNKEIARPFQNYLLPLVVDDAIPRSNGVDILWNGQGDTGVVAGMLCNELGVEENPASIQNVARQLEVYSQLYSKEHGPTTGGKGSILRVSYAAKISEEPEPAVFVDTVNWDLNTPDAFADVYAARVASDLKLTNLNAVRIGMELRNALNKAKRAVSAGTYTLKPLASPSNVLRKERSKLPAVVRGDKAREYLEMWQKRNHQSGSAAVVNTAHDNPSEDATRKPPLLSSSPPPPEQNAVS